MGTVTINGRTYTGNSINVVNGKVIIDGKDVTDPLQDAKKINIAINGSIASLSVDVCEKVGVIGTVQDIKTMSGNVVVRGPVEGNVKTMSGNVTAGTIKGNASSMSGNIS